MQAFWNFIRDLLEAIFVRPAYDNGPLTHPMNDPDVLGPWTTATGNRHNVRVIADQEGLTVAQKNLMSQVIHCESGYNPQAINYNKDPITGKITSTDHGICQWNDYFHGKEISPTDATNDPEKAVRLMCTYIKAGRISQWSCYKLGLYKNYTA